MTNKTLKEQEYDIVCQNFRRFTCDSHILEGVKTLFTNEIKSTRTYDRIRSISELITVLEKRDSLNVDNIIPFKNIAFQLRHPDLLQTRHMLRAQPLLTSQPVSSGQSVQTCPLLSHPITYLISIQPEVKQKVYERIASDIGKNWKDFARKLGIREGMIDDLDDNTKSLKEKVYKILFHYEENCDPRTWRSKLQDGLVQARRSDLQIAVQNIFDTHSI